MSEDRIDRTRDILLPAGACSGFRAQRGATLLTCLGDLEEEGSAVRHRGGGLAVPGWYCAGLLCLGAW